MYISSVPYLWSCFISSYQTIMHLFLLFLQSNPTCSYSSFIVVLLCAGRFFIQSGSLASCLEGSSFGLAVWLHAQKVLHSSFASCMEGSSGSSIFNGSVGLHGVVSNHLCLISASMASRRLFYVSAFHICKGLHSHSCIMFVLHIWHLFCHIQWDLQFKVLLKFVQFNLMLRRIGLVV